VVGDDVPVQEPKDEQRESDPADECEHNQNEARESVGAKCCGRRASRPRFAGAGGGSVAIRFGYYAASGTARGRY
jgi:hypothetical protein